MADLATASLPLASVPRMTPRDQLLVHALYARVGPDWDAISQSMISLTHENIGGASHGGGAPAAAESLFSPTNCHEEYTEVTTKLTRGRTDVRTDVAVGKALRKRHLDELQRSIRKHEEEYKKMAIELQHVNSDRFTEPELKALIVKYDREAELATTIFEQRKPRLDQYPLPQAATRQVEEPPVIVSPTTSAAESPAKPADDSTSVVGTSGAAETSAMAIDETKLIPGGSGTKGRHHGRSPSPSKSATRSEKKGRKKAEASPPPTDTAAAEEGVLDMLASGEVTPRSTRSHRGSPALRSRRGSPSKTVDTASEAEPDPEAPSARPTRGRKRTRVDQVEDDAASDSGSAFGAYEGNKYGTPERSPQPEMIADTTDGVDDTEDEDYGKTQRAWRASVMQLWHQIAENKNANLFRHPVDPKKVEGYTDVVLRPMDLGTIKKNIELGIVASARDMEHALMLMYTNALMFNETGEFVYDATLEMRGDTLSQLEDFRRIITSNSEHGDGRENRRKKTDDGTPRSKRSRQGRSA
eukprot:m.189542 g.189542  ORF g.189542 m.189542 type:complete len:527 (+) comp24859_c0_seq1:36-1616(+)